MSICHIFAGGDLGSIGRDRFAAHEGTIICADCGLRHAEALGLEPDIIVGDFDSYGGELPQNAEVHRSVPEKDDTDTLLAVKIAIERGCELIYLYGALGGARFDHAFANIQTMIYACEHGAEVVLVGSERVYLQGTGERSYPRTDGDGYFSVFALTETVEIRSLHGVKYPLGGYTMKRSYPIGVSNEITGEAATLAIDSGLALVIQSQ
ncbi:MAG: thiamine diphosphokinase [Ruminococcus sp.]|nr:thiamine diphosphokinase [Ruminococcus sp.]